jgi:aspartyl-tRNA(Asn)/glutamyl-tRNA(Gln) amidotransferase subunit A
MDMVLSTPLSDADPLCALGVEELTRQYGKNELSPVDVIRAVLSRAEEIDGKLNAFTRIDHEGALASAAASERRWRRQEPLSEIDGIPTTIKDIVWVKNFPTGYGSLSTDRLPAETDCPAVGRLRDAGAVFVGLTTTPEFGWKAVTDSPLTGVTRSPWDSRLTPGGSSGGAAVAAATGAGVLHLGTDGGGSIRIPAAFCGLVGVKPSFGRVPAYPASAFGTVAHLGPITRRTYDAFAMLLAISGHDRRDWFQGANTLPPLSLAPIDLAGLKIGFWRTPPVGQLDPEIGAAVDGATMELERCGCIIEPVELPNAAAHSMFQTLWYAGAANRAARLSPSQLAQLDPGLQEAIAAGNEISAPQYVHATMGRTAYGLAMDALLEKYDFLVSPATSIPPFDAGLEVPSGSDLSRWTEWAGFSFPVNLSQQPAIVAPCGRTAGGLPIGIQFIGARGADARVFSIAKAFEAILPQFFL